MAVIYGLSRYHAYVALFPCTHMQSLRPILFFTSVICSSTTGDQSSYRLRESIAPQHLPSLAAFTSAPLLQIKGGELSGRSRSQSRSSGHRYFRGTSRGKQKDKRGIIDQARRRSSTCSITAINDMQSFFFMLLSSECRPC